MTTEPGAIDVRAASEGANWSVRGGIDPCEQMDMNHARLIANDPRPNRVRFFTSIRVRFSTGTDSEWIDEKPEQALTFREALEAKAS